MEKPPQRIDFSEEVFSKQEQAKNEVLERIENKNEGIDMEKINSFFKEHGFEIDTPIIFMDKEDFLKVREIYSNHNLNIPEDESTGACIVGDSKASTIIFVFRNLEIEEANGGTTVTEALAVHELAHAIGTHGAIFERISGQSEYIASKRSGFSLTSPNKRKTGNFLEEGWVDFMRGLFVSQNISEKEEYILRNKVASLAEVSIEKITLETVIMGTLDGFELEVPLKFLFLGENNNFDFNHPSIAGYATEKLFKRNPNLENVYRTARESVEGLRQVATEIDKIQPGLYKKLLVLQYSTEDFNKGFKFVEDALA